MKNKILAISFIFSSILIVTVAGCGKKRNTHQKAVSSDEVIAVKVINITEGNNTEPIKASGLVSSLTEARLSFKTTGIIEKIYVREGQSVKKGQLLATLNLTEINAQVSQATDNVSKVERDLKRINNLYKDSVATLEQVQNLSTALSVAKQNLEIAKYNQGFSKIYATTSGVVVKKLMNEGELANAGTGVLFINATGANDWVVKVGIADKDWTRLRIGDHAKVQLDAFPNQIFTASVSNLSQGADQTSGLYQAELKLNTSGSKMATGLFANSLIIPSVIQKFTSVPLDAIIEGNGKDAYVFVLEGNIAKKHLVKLAGVTTDKAFVESGLSGIQSVITDGSAYLVDGTKVKVVQ
ncbi:RND family efflux transporter, MFP subunit [Pseudarcicella hirudinis]|uniref:RND family efflux transporter, MFP subunit n=1 Tax=Pseudarcicella hirudinis TaxID=1079859 RepID=A0A1I5VUM4_9BACT|nr:efflux RND transporter periplasmic adaptor subunit [Pseudarcicella hirudinis]SFQ11248.1 RND family efflux transporter, MFP subunit [Pseudarcicella hirudinis]